MSLGTATIKIQILNAAQAEAEIRRLQQSMAQLGTSGSKISSGVNQGAQSFQQLSAQAKTADGQLRIFGSDIQKVNTGLRPIGASATQAASGTDKLGKSIRQSAVEMQGMGTATTKTATQLDQVGASANKATGFTNKLKGAFQQIQPHISGLAFATFGMFGAVNEFAFSADNAATSAEKLGAAQAELARLTAEGKQNTSEYAQAQRDVADATRANTFAQRIARQSFFDIISFTGILGIQLGGLVQKLVASRKEMQATGQAARAVAVEMKALDTVTATSGTSVTGLGGKLKGLIAGLVGVGGAAGAAAGGAKALASGISPLNNSINTASNTAANLVGSMGPLGRGMADAAKNSGQLESGAAKAGAGLSGLLGVVAPLGIALAGAIGLFFSYSKAVEQLADPLSTASKAVQGFIKWLGDLLSFIPGAQSAFQELGKSVTFFAQYFTEAFSRLPLIGSLFQSQGKSISDLVNKMGLLGKETDATTQKQQQMSEALQKTQDDINKLHPAVANIAKQWGLYDNAQLAASASGQQMLSGLQSLDKEVDTAVQNARDLAVANGVTLHDALAMTDQQLVDFVANAKTLGPTLQMQAEMAKQAAQDFADSWKAGFDKISEANSQWGSTMKSATDKVLDDLGKEVKIGWGDKKMKFAKDFGFNEDFWNEFFPSTVARQAFKNNFDIDNLIQDTESTLKGAIHKGLISRDDMKEGFQPLLDFMKEDLPADSEEAFGYLVSAMPEMMQKLNPSIVNGFIKVGANAKEAIQNGLVTPIIDTLNQGLGADKTAPLIVGNLKAMIPQIQAMNPQLAGAFKNALVDPFTQQERPVQEQVQRITELLGQINPAFKDMIFGIDKDADGIADIMDNQILGPVDQMRAGVVAAFADAALAAGDTAGYNKLIQKYNDITGESKPLIANINGVQTAIGEMGRVAEGTAVKFGDLTKAFDAWAATVDTSKLDFSNFKGPDPTELLGPATVTKDDLTPDLRKTTTAAKPPPVQAPDTSPFVNAFAGLAAQIKPHLDGLYKSLSDYLKQLSNLLGTVDFQSILTKFQGLYQQYIAPALGTVISGIQSWLPAIGAIFTNADFGPILAKFQTIYQTYIAPALGQIIAGISSWMPAISAIFTSADFGPILAKFQGIYQTYIAPALGSIISSLSAWIPSIAATFSRIDFTTVKTAFDNLWNNYIAPGLTKVSTQAGGWISGLVTMFSGIDLSGMKTTFDNLYNNYIKPGLDTAKSLAEQAWAGITALFTNPFQTANAEEEQQTTNNPANISGPTNPTGAETAVAMQAPDFTAARKAWDDYNLKVQEVLGAVALQWQSHLAQFQSMFTQPLAAQLTIAGTFYQTSYAQLVGAYLGATVIAWQGHITALQATFVQPLAAQLTIAGQFYQTAYAAQVGAALGGVVVAWGGHVTAIAGQVNAIGQHIARLVQGYSLLISAATQTAGQVASRWSAMAGAVNSQVNRMGQSIGKLVQGMGLLIQAAQQTNSRVSSSFSSMASSGSSSANRLAGAVSSAMRRIVSSMNQAASAARNLQSAINSLRSKTITVTTRYKTVGSPGGTQRAAKGFQGIVTQPTRFFTGEGNKPEFVSVTPLAGNSDAKANTQARAFTDVMSMGKGIAPTIRAGRGAKKAVVYTEYQPDGDKIIYYSDGSKKKKHYKRRGYSSWGSAARDDFGDISGRIIPFNEQLAWQGKAPTEEDFLRMRKKQIDRLAALRKKEEDKKNKGSSSTGTGDKSPINPDTGAVHKGSRESYYGGRQSVTQVATHGGSIINAGTGGRFGKGGIFHMAAYGGVGDTNIKATGFEGLDIRYMYAPEDLDDDGDLTKKAKKRLKKAMKKSDVKKIKYYANGIREVIYEDGTSRRERWSAGGTGISPISGGPGSATISQISAKHGYEGLIRKQTQLTVGEGNRPEYLSVTPYSELRKSMSGVNADNVGPMVRNLMAMIKQWYGSGQMGGGNVSRNREVIVQSDNHTTVIQINGKEIARAMNKEMFKGVMSF